MTRRRARVIRTLGTAALAVAIATGLSICHAADASQRAVMSWQQAIEAAKSDPSCKPAVDALVRQARAAMAKGLVRRARSLTEVGKHRTWLDGRTKALEPEIKETFALAMSDFAACNTLAGELPMIAAAYKLSGDTVLRRHVTEQLQEATTWSPLQRPGWTLYAPGHRLPKDGKDGNWLATGCGVRAIVTTLEIMGQDIEPALRKALDGLLAREIAGVVDDWRTKRPWFVRSNNPITNQWVLPTEGLVRACLHLGVDRRRQAYELGIKNLIAALSAHGSKGEFEEGIGYANFTVTSLVHTARAMAVAGDRRAIDHPFLTHFPTWAVHHIQPGRMTVNCFDAGNASVPRSQGHWRSMLSLLSFTTGSQVANWALSQQFDGPSDDLIGLLTRAIGKQIGQQAPGLFASYERAAMVVWRDSWDDSASGVWVRGGHRLDQHDHQDRGHANYIHRGKAILIEAGTPSYSNPDMNVHYSSGAGHNVLQVGTSFPERPYPVQATAKYPGWQRPKGIAPITVERLDKRGGAVRVEAGRCYTDTEQWQRCVEWSANAMTIRDRVRLKPGKHAIILFRWHLGTDQPVALARKGEPPAARWTDAEIRFQADAPLDIRQHMAPDATLSPKQDHQHTCLVVTSRQAVQALVLTTSVRAR